MANPERRLDALIAKYRQTSAPANRRIDGWANFFQGYGVRGRDPSAHDEIAAPVEFNRMELEHLYRGDAIAARAIDLLPDDATRQGWRLKLDTLKDGSDLTPEDSNEIGDGVNEYSRKILGRPRIRQGLTLGRLFGGALMVLGVDDGGFASNLSHFADPVREEAIKSLRWVQVIDRFACTPGPLVVDPLSAEFGQPEWYEINGLTEASQVRVHASRVVRFKGSYSPTKLQGTTTGGTTAAWDDSVITRIWSPLSRFEIAYASCSRIVRDFSRAVYTIKNLHRHIAGNQEAIVRRRLEIAELSISALNALLLDPDGESFNFMQRPVQGLPELLDRLGIFLATATGTPITHLLGVSPGGLGTGEDEDRRWNNRVSSYQEDDVLPPLERLYRYIFLAKDGPTKGVLPQKWGIIFNALKAPSQKETAEIRSIVSMAYAKLVEQQILLPEEVAEGMFGGSEFRVDITLDREAREALKATREQEAEAESEDPNIDPEAVALMQEQRSAASKAANTDAITRHSDGIMRILERVHDDAIPASTGARLMASLYGYPLDEAERLLGVNAA